MEAGGIIPPASIAWTDDQLLNAPIIARPRECTQCTWFS
jgi:hypothetical protein